MNKFLNSFEMPLRQKTVGVKNSTSCITSPFKDSSHSVINLLHVMLFMLFTILILKLKYFIYY
jgi:hypothetical protein